MTSKIKPSELAGLDLAKYKKLLEQDFARASKENKFIDYVFIQGYKIGSKKTNLLLLVDPADQLWTAAIETAKGNGKKNAVGKCKVLKDEETSSEITLVIKTAKGDLAKAKVVTAINEEMFKDDFGVEAIMVGDDEDVSNEDLLDKKKRNIGNSENLKDGTTFSQDATLKDKTGQESKMTPFVEALDAFFKVVGSIDALSVDIKNRLEEIQGLHKEHKGTDKYKSKVLPSAHETVRYIETLVPQLEDIIAKGNYWLKENGDLFAQPLRSKDTVTRHKNKVKETEQQVEQAQRIMRQLIQVQDNILEKYLKDYSSTDKIYEAQLDNEKDLFERIVEQFKKYTALEDDKYSERMSCINLLCLWSKNWHDGDYKSEKHKDILTKIDKKIAAERNVVENGMMNLLPDEEAFSDIQLAHKKFLKIKGDTLENWVDKNTLLEEISNKLNTLNSPNPVAKQLKDVMLNQVIASRRIVEKMKATEAINELVEEAQKKGALSPENLFDAFMKKYRGKVAYTPEHGGTVLDGCTNANCQDLTSAFVRVLKETGFKGADAPVLETYYITTPVDDQWIDSTAGGNINFVGTTEKRYFFSEHWVVDYQGARFCPTTGRKGGEIKDTIWGKVGSIAVDQVIEVKTFNFSNLKGKEGTNNGMTYRLEAKK